MEEQIYTLLQACNISSEELSAILPTLTDRDRTKIIPCLQKLREKSFLNEKNVLILLQRPTYAEWITNLLLQIHAIGLDSTAYLARIAAVTESSYRYTSILKDWVKFHINITATRLNNLLDMSQGDELAHLFHMLQRAGQLTAERVDLILSNPNLDVLAYSNCVDSLLKSHLFNPAVEQLLLQSNDTIHELQTALADLCKHTPLTHDLIALLMQQKTHTAEIASGIQILSSRISYFSTEDAKIIIAAADQAYFVARSLSFMIPAQLDNQDNREALLTTKADAEAVNLMLCNLANLHQLTEENFADVIAVAPLIGSPTILNMLRKTSMIESLGWGQISCLLFSLGTLAYNPVPETASTALLEACASMLALDPITRTYADMVVSALSDLMQRINPVQVRHILTVIRAKDTASAVAKCLALLNANGFDSADNQDSLQKNTLFAPAISILLQQLQNSHAFTQADYDQVLTAAPILLEMPSLLDQLAQIPQSRPIKTSVLRELMVDICHHIQHEAIPSTSHEDLMICAQKKDILLQKCSAMLRSSDSYADEMDDEQANCATFRV